MQSVMNLITAYANYIIFTIVMLLLMFIVYYNLVYATKYKKVQKTFVQQLSQKQYVNYPIIDFFRQKIKIFDKLYNKIATKIEMYGIDVTADEILQKSLYGAGIGLIIGLVLLNPLSMLLLGIIGFAIPIINFEDQVYKQSRKIDKQVLKAIQLFLNEYQKTQNIVEVIERIYPMLEPPVRNEFARLLRQLNSGIHYKEAFNDMAKRLDNEWIYMFVNALLIHMEQGSEIVDVLLKTVTKISNKEIVQNEKDMETFSGRLLNKMMILSVPTAFVAVLFVRPEAKILYFTTFTGKLILNIAIILCIVSFLITRYVEKV